MKNFNYMSYKVYKNGKLASQGTCDKEKVKDELISDFTSNLFYKDCKIKEIYYKNIEVTWYNIIADDEFKTVRVYKEI